jgi:multicomponent Na+:H+ antiporter subunit B
VTTSNSLILHTATRFLLPLQLLFSIFLLLRGHDEPGGGFIAGLVAAGALALYLFAFDIERTRRLIRVAPHELIGMGLLFSALSGVPALLMGYPYLTALWWEPVFPFFGKVKLSTPLIFDVGVYLTVIGAVLTIVLALAQAEE